MNSHRSAFRVRRPLAAFVALVMGVAIAVTVSAGGASARHTPRVARWADRSIASNPVVHNAPAAQRSRPVREIARSNGRRAHRLSQASSPAQVFEGISNNSTISPPDPTGDVSATQYVQAVNTLKGAKIGVYDKASGSATATFLLDDLWQGKGLCAKHGEGDPVVQFDPLAQRWVLSQFAFQFDDFGNPISPYNECIAISTSEDATGSYFPYSYLISKKQFPDFPKFGVWSDGYYMSIHLFGQLGYKQQGIIAFDRENMLTGGAAREQIFFVNKGLFGLLPSDVEGTTPPPAGAPDYLVTVRDDDVGANADRIFLYAFYANFDHPRHSKILGAAILKPQAFSTKLCNGNFYCLGQKGTGMKLDAIAGDPGLGAYLMYPFVYRNFGDHEALLLEHTVKVGATRQAGIHWMEIRDPSTTPSLYQEGTYAPDTLSRWVGSIGFDGFGDIGLAYSTTSSDTHPSIAFTGRLANDTLGAMTQGENLIIAGNGSQTASPRWGDYTALSVDPTDDCTFWYTNEFYPSNSHYTWHTAIASFRMPTCSGAPSPTPSSSASASATP
ncbi:MAG: hypothetical protein ABR579_10055 [Actinomycetota bacterium]